MKVFEFLGTFGPLISSLLLSLQFNQQESAGNQDRCQRKVKGGGRGRFTVSI